MSSRILVVYQTSEGQTAKIAERIAETLRERGNDVDVRDVEHAPAPDGYDGVVVGDSIHAVKHSRPMIRYIGENVGALNAKPSALFQVCLTSANPDEQHTASAHDARAGPQERTGFDPDAVGMFAGALVYTQYGWFKRHVMRAIVKHEGGDLDMSQGLRVHRLGRGDRVRGARRRDRHRCERAMSVDATSLIIDAVMPTFDVEHRGAQHRARGTVRDVSRRRELDFLSVRTPLLDTAMWVRGLPARVTHQAVPCATAPRPGRGRRAPRLGRVGRATRSGARVRRGREVLATQHRVARRAGRRLRRRSPSRAGARSPRTSRCSPTAPAPRC